MQQQKNVIIITIMKKLLDLDALYGFSGGLVLYIADSFWKGNMITDVHVLLIFLFCPFQDVNTCNY